jgi:hypothetical protein
MMRLADLEPRWTVRRLDVGRTDYSLWPEPLFATGVTFLCPHCGKERLGVQFEPALDPAGILPTFIDPPWDRDRPIWKRTGDTFETLTLTPSVDASKSGHWHGFITNGEIK